MAKKITIDVYVDATSFDDIKSYEILSGGCLKIVERDGDVHVFSPSSEWHLLERIER